MQALREREQQQILLWRKKGEKHNMPVEMIKKMIGSECTVTLFNEICGISGILLEVEENWIKIEEKKRIRIINGEMIRDISVEKYR
ncbi:MAG: hypothetical protein IJO10_10015 [Clostridia bacterium]|nr:hypothetical protein [Clostridia bacterium]